MATIDRIFGEKFLTSVDDFDAYGVHLLFNDWWETAPQDVIDKYVAAIENHPEQGPMARAQCYAAPADIDHLATFAPGTVGAAYYRFIVDNGLEARLAVGYRELHDEIASTGKLARMPDVIRYKVLRGYQTHDLHHVLTGYAATPLDELALQAFGLAQMSYPYAGMWVAVVTAHMTLVDPDLMIPAMDAITDGLTYGKAARNIQLLPLEHQLHRPLADVRAEYGLRTGTTTAMAMADAA
jgi:ubiquinone biosynthesis protein COQ4